MPRFIHTADWQIGRQFDTFGPEDGPLLAEARLRCVERIAQLATERAADAVLVAGDVFDAQSVSDRTVRRLFAALGGFAGPWVLLPGNHDAALAESVWDRAQRLGVVPAHVHLALRPEPILLPSATGRGLAVLPAPLTQRHVFDDLTAWFDHADTPPDGVRVGLAHGAVLGLLPDDIDAANPIAADRAQRARLDYLALGDWHGCLMVNERTAYSGTPEPERFRNNDPGWVLEVDIPAPGATPTITRHRTAQHAWVEHRLRLDVPSDLQQALDTLAQLPAQAVLSVRCEGHIDLAGHERLHAALQAAQAHLRAVRADLSALRVVPTDADLAALHADGYLGEVIAELRDAQAHDGDDVSRAALLLLADLLRSQGATGAAV